MRFSTSKHLHINDHLKPRLGYKSCPRTLGTEDLVYGETQTHDLMARVQYLNHSAIRSSLSTVSVCLPASSDSWLVDSLMASAIISFTCSMCDWESWGLSDRVDLLPVFCNCQQQNTLLISY